MFSIKSTVLAATMAMVLMAGSAEAGGYAAYQNPAYKVVVCYETRTLPKTVAVIRYDHCGHPYLAAKTIYVTVTVPVKKLVPIY